jgi:nitric oxide reductase NorD protein
MRLKDLLEPEETVGSAWHGLAAGVEGVPRFPEAAVPLDALTGALSVFFRGLGGEPGIVIKAAAPAASLHRRRRFERIARDRERLTRARIDGDSLYLPPVIEAFPIAELNRLLYAWLTAWAATAAGHPSEPAADAQQADIAALRQALAITGTALARYPGLQPTWRALAGACLTVRPRRRLPGVEAQLEACIRAILGETEVPDNAAALYAVITDPRRSFADWTAPRGYRPHLPVPLWGEVAPRPLRRRRAADDEPADAPPGAPQPGDDRTYKGRRDETPEHERKDALILNRFEKLLSWAEFLRISRGVDDEDPDQARKAADDHDEIILARTKRRAASRLHFDLDLAPDEVEHDRLSAPFVYPEWDYRRQAYLPDHCRILERVADAPAGAALWKPDDAARRRIRAVRRQFEALRPRREIARRQIDGGELDMEALIRSRCDLAARGDGSDQVYLQARQQERDLAVAVLIDASRSTESFVDNRQVIDLAKEALTALTQGLEACGDDHAIYGFSSCRRTRVWVSVVKPFEEPSGPAVLARIAALRPGHYTRLGAAIRHVSHVLSARPRQRRLLLVVTDGKPNDLDHYEGRYGIEDAGRAVREARRLGHAVFGITIDRKAQSYFPAIFGGNAFALLRHAQGLTTALPLIYRHIVM